MTQKDTKSPPPPIAIVGMGLRLPGGISTPDEFWNHLVNKKDNRSRVPSTRYNVDAFTRGDQHVVASEYGYFLDDVNLKAFDASFFSMNRSEVEILDPQQRLLLEVVWECMERAGQKDWRGTDVGCYVGAFGEDWYEMLAKDPQLSVSGHSRVTTASDFALSNRVSYEYNLHGPSMTIRTTCSSSITALHEACQDLTQGQCSAAIVAGASLILSPSTTLDVARVGVLSRTGSCKTFDAAADGYVRGEAINAILIKRLDDAIRNQDPIRAVIRSTALNSDGKTAGLPLPSLESHERLIRKAYQMAGLDPSQTRFFECHGTGTVIGDPLEATAVANVFREHGTYIGSTKPNFGHSEGASGITSLIKAVLALEKELIPPNMHFKQWNPKIPGGNGTLRVPCQLVWRRRSQRTCHHRLGFFIATTGPVEKPKGLAPEGEPSLSWPRLVPISANNAESLGQRVQGVLRYMELNPGSVEGVSHTLGSRRDHLLYRTYCVAHQDGRLSEFQSGQRRRDDPQVVFVFTGQGAQWAGMGRDLILASSSFKHSIRAMDRTLCGQHSTDLVNKPEYGQPLCTAIQVALVDFMSQCGIRPGAVIGHSSGEIAAAYAAGAVTAAEAILISYCRGQVMQLQQRKGGMAVVGLPRDAVSAYLVDGVVVACENSPKNVTLSGDGEALQQTLDRIRADKVDCFIRQLSVDMAYHSDHMHDIGDAYEKLLNSHLALEEATGRVPLYSTVSGQRKPDFKTSYWRENMEKPVLFSSALQTLLRDLHQETLFVEVGPHSALSSSLTQSFAAYSTLSHDYIPTLKRGGASATAVVDTLGQLYMHGYPVDLSSINRPGPILVDLPNYPWDRRTEFWDESRLSLAWRQLKHPYHELLGFACLETSDLEPAWRNVLRLEAVPWLNDHKVIRDVIFPCAGYVAMMGEAIRQVTASPAYTLQDFIIHSPIVLQDSNTVELITTMKPTRLTDRQLSSWFEITISSYSGASWVQNCVGLGKAAEEATEAQTSKPRYPRQPSSESWYKRLRRLGLNYGPCFQGMKELRADTQTQSATASVCNQESEPYPVHPTTIDSCLQLFTVAVSNGIARRLETLTVPSTVSRISIRPGGACAAVDAHAVVARAASNGAMSGNVVAVSDDGGVIVVDIRDAKMSPLETGDDDDDDDATRFKHAGLSYLKWRPDINFLDPATLIRTATSNRDFWLRLDKLCYLGLLQLVDIVDSMDAPPTGHLAKYLSWLREEKQRMRLGQSSIPESQQWATLTAASRRTMSVQVTEQVYESSSREMALVFDMVRKLFDEDMARRLFQGEIHALQVMMEDDGLTHFYNIDTRAVDYRLFLSLCGHAQPGIKVLEIGSGTGTMTEEMINGLRTTDGTPLFSLYTFTDISSGFFAAARERFRGQAGLEYRVLDISRDPADQGFQLGSYDLVVASNVDRRRLTLLVSGHPCYPVSPRQPVQRPFVASSRGTSIAARTDPADEMAKHEYSHGPPSSPSVFFPQTDLFDN
ncbi:hypothetical protein XA68_15148 [Ophiocordyceps unilateralis]|uniref:Carrier domain-containing protein n=1 Tax=Ophiocordyceps unilateralis TaxID=268505 RepID=A0A2A9P903_OPHUN|nr:hypothetical protein XA68_15148 [Ophiocordyceps unilateralis]